MAAPGGYTGPPEAVLPINDDQPIAGSDEVHPRNALNHLTGRQWLYFTKSVLRTSYPSTLGHAQRKRQGGNKPPQLMQHYIEFFTKRDQLVLDPFAGAGGTLLGAHLAGRRAIGIEINPVSIDLYREVCQAERIEPMPIEQGDCRIVLVDHAEASVDFVATDPPYSIRLAQTMSGVSANATYQRANRRSSYVTYSDDPRDLSNLADFDAFFAAMVEVGRELFRVLRPGHYGVFIVRDAYQNGEYIPTSFRIAEQLRDAGFKLKAINVWYGTGARLRPYGYPNSYVPNLIHQNVVIVQKPRSAR